MSRFIEIENRLINTDNISCVIEKEEDTCIIYFIGSDDDKLIINESYNYVKNIILNGVNDE